MFVRRALIALGYGAHEIRVVPFPRGGLGSGEQHVRERFGAQLEAYRRRASRRRAALVVHVDADLLTVEARWEALVDTLRAGGVPPPAANEAVAVLIPRREIETWIHFFLDGPPIDEAVSYPKYKGRESETWPAAEAFARHARDATTPTDAPPSLLHGLAKARQLR